MSYSPSALNAAMTKSLKFENINTEILVNNITYSLCTLNPNNIYKFNIIGDNFVIITEVLGTKIMYVNSYISTDTAPSLYLGVISSIVNNEAVYKLAISGIATENLSLEVEYSFDNFILNFEKTEINNTSLTKYTFKEQHFTELRAGKLNISQSFNIGTINAEKLEITNFKLGNWKFSGKDNKITLTYDEATT